MNGKITIDGYSEDGKLSTTIHGDKPDSKALCSLTMQINRNIEVRELVKMMQDYIERSIEENNPKEYTSYLKKCLKTRLKEVGAEIPTDTVLDYILDEVAFQRAAE